jgi:hypothetical protein
MAIFFGVDSINCIACMSSVFIFCEITFFKLKVEKF